MSVNINREGVVITQGGINDNLFLDSAQKGNSSSWSGTYVDEDGLVVRIHKASASSVRSWDEHYLPISTSAAGNPLGGQQICISLDFMTDDVSVIHYQYFGFGIFSGAVGTSGGTRLTDTNIRVDEYTILNAAALESNKWYRIYYVYTVPSQWTADGVTYRIQIKTQNAYTNEATMYYKRVKVELGDHPTPYCVGTCDGGFADQAFAESSLTLPSFGKSWISTKDFTEI